MFELNPYDIHLKWNIRAFFRIKRWQELWLSLLLRSYCSCVFEKYRRNISIQPPKSCAYFGTLRLSISHYKIDSKKLLAVLLEHSWVTLIVRSANSMQHTLTDFFQRYQSVLPLTRRAVNVLFLLPLSNDRGSCFGNMKSLFVVSFFFITSLWRSTYQAIYASPQICLDK